MKVSVETPYKPASYDMRIGKKLLLSGVEDEIDMEKKGAVTLKAGQFALLTTYEKLKFSSTMVGHLGLKTYYVRKGVVVLTGLQVDPGFDGVLVLGVYNASPRSVTLEFLAPICTLEFHRLSKPVQKSYTGFEEQRSGLIPRADKDYLRTLETQTLSKMSEALRQLSENVGKLSTALYVVLIPLMLIVVGGVVVGLVLRLF